MDAAALGRRTVATLRARFESVRPEGPIPALMAEVPAGHPSPFDENERHPRPPVLDFHRPDLFYLGWASVFGPGQTSDSAAVAFRHIWLAGPPIALDRLRGAWRDAAGFGSAIRSAAGLRDGSGAGTVENHWLWTMFEVAERRVAFSPLQLRGGFVTVAYGHTHFPEPQVAAVRGNPESDGFFAEVVRGTNPGPTRYWEIVDAVEASLMLLDLVAVALPAVIERERSIGGSPVEERPGEPVRATEPRGATTCERLRALYEKDPDFAVKATVRDLARRIERSTGALDDSYYYKNTLKKERDSYRACKKKEREAQRWGHFDSIPSPDGDTDEDH